MSPMCHAAVRAFPLVVPCLRLHPRLRPSRLNGVARVLDVAPILKQHDVGGERFSFRDFSELYQIRLMPDLGLSLSNGNLDEFLQVRQQGPCVWRHLLHIAVLCAAC